MVLGCIPVIYDYQAQMLAAMLDGVLFKSVARFEDVFVILDTEVMQRNQEYPFYIMLSMVREGEHLRRFERLKQLADYLVIRQDELYDDTLTITWG